MYFLFLIGTEERNKTRIKNKSIWSEFINLAKKENLTLSGIKDKKLSFSYLNYSKEFNIQESDYKIKWFFSPLKIFQINANQ